MLWVKPKDLHPNAFNVNVLDEDMYRRAVASIETFGFVDPITVRVVNDAYEIVDGENRWKAAEDLNLKLVPVVIIEADDDTAQQLSIVLNELRGRPDRAKLQRLLAGLAERHSVDELLRTLPFNRESFLSVQPPPLPPSTAAGLPSTRWVERMYRLPRPAADTLDAALAKAKEFEEVSDDWKALEAIAQRYLET